MAAEDIGAGTTGRESVMSYWFRAQMLPWRVDFGLNLLAYLTVAVSAVMSLTTGRTLSLVPALLLVVLNLAWVVLFWLLWRPQDVERDKWEVVGGLLAISLGVDGLAWFGLGLDWLLPVLTVSILAFYLRARPAAVIAVGGVVVMVLVMLTVPGIYTLQDRLQSMISLFPAYFFSFLFSVFMRQQFEQRARAEGLVAQLEEAQEQLRAHAESVEELAIARERNRMAREIHDTLGHYLTILAVQLETAIKLEERDDPRLREELTEARRVASECLVEVRRSVRALRPVDPTAASFAGALERLRAEFEAAAPETELTLDVEGPVQALAPELRIALYRCAQEAMTNVRKHAQATKVLVRVRVDGSRAELTVLDNGHAGQAVQVAHDAHEAPAHEPGFGLLGMRERMALLGGTVRASAERGRGWRVEVVVPIAAAPVEDERYLASTEAQPAGDDGETGERAVSADERQTVPAAAGEDRQVERA